MEDRNDLQNNAEVESNMEKLQKLCSRSIIWSHRVEELMRNGRTLHTQVGGFSHSQHSP